MDVRKWELCHEQSQKHANLPRFVRRGPDRLYLGGFRRAAQHRFRRPREARADADPGCRLSPLLSHYGDYHHYRHYGYYHRYRHYGYYHHRYYGYNPGAAVAGAALGVLGLGIGAATLGDCGFYGCGYGYGYGPSYGYYGGPYYGGYYGGGRYWHGGRYGYGGWHGGRYAYGGGIHTGRSVGFGGHYGGYRGGFYH